MSLKHWPPKVNDSIPSWDYRLQRALAEIGGDVPDTHLPWARFCWGQDPGHRRFYAGKDMMAHTHHCDREQVLAQPEYRYETKADPKTGLVGTQQVLTGWKKWFKRPDIVPAEVAPILIPMTLRTDIGINRWFLEIADIHDEAEWEKLRYTDANNLTVLDEQGNPIDFLGPHPEGGVTYHTFMVLGKHHGVCDCKMRSEGRHSGACCCEFELKGEICPGEYREPNRNDVRACEGLWRHFVETRRNSYGLRDKAPDNLVDIEIHLAKSQQKEKERILEEALRDANRQELSPFWHRLTNEGHGADLYQYHDLGSPTLTPRDNQSRRGPRVEDSKCHQTHEAQA